MQVTYRVVKNSVNAIILIYGAVLVLSMNVTPELSMIVDDVKYRTVNEMFSSKTGDWLITCCIFSKSIIFSKSSHGR